MPKVPAPATDEKTSEAIAKTLSAWWGSNGVVLNCEPPKYEYRPRADSSENNGDHVEALPAEEADRETG
jgi:hypothetical protein